MTLVERLRKAVALVAAGKTEAQAAKQVRLKPEDVRLAVLMPDKVDKFAIRIAEREADDAEQPTKRKRERREPGVRSRRVSTEPDKPKGRKPKKRASDAVKPVKVSRARAVRAMGGNRTFLTPEDEAELRRRTKRAKPIEPDVRDLINAAMDAGKVTIGPTLHARGALRWPSGLGAAGMLDGRRRRSDKR